ncbi:hypothetical protein SNEBB_010912 [Seison nebaliae]|nr:hypothetical protein SNEBB_010912 [Seison nebaliae]
MDEKNISETTTTSKKGEQIKMKPKLTVNDVLKLKQFTPDFLCSPEENVYDIAFCNFCLRDAETNEILFQLSPFVVAGDSSEENILGDHAPEGNIARFSSETSDRYIHYVFDAAILRKKIIGTTVEFSVGERPLKNFAMIERHYFKNEMIKSFHFNFPFCIPNSHNACEHIYEMPQLSSRKVEEILKTPNGVKSDSFYFVNDELVMHHKASYTYVDYSKRKTG